jgi:hypothetical protein
MFDPENAQQEFEKFLSGKGLHQHDLTLADGCEAVFDFYRELRPRGRVFEQQKGADMLLLQWGTYDWGAGIAGKSTTRSSGSLPSKNISAFDKNRRLVSATSRTRIIVFSVAQSRRALTIRARYFFARGPGPSISISLPRFPSGGRGRFCLALPPGHSVFYGAPMAEWVTEQTKEFFDLSTRATQHVFEKVQDATTKSFK